MEYEGDDMWEEYPDDEWCDFDEEAQTWDTPPPGEWTDPALVEAAAPLAEEGGPTELLLALLRDRHDARLEIAEGISAATLRWPTGLVDGRGRPLLDADPARPRPKWEVTLVGHDSVAWSLTDTGDGLTPGDGEDEDDDEGDIFGVEADIPRGPSREFPRRLRAAFEDARRQVLLALIGVSLDMINWWSLVARGPLPQAARSLHVGSNSLLEREPGQSARWLIYLADQDPGRHAVLMSALWADPALHLTGYRVLDAVRPGWIGKLPALAPPDDAGVIEWLVDRGAGDLACQALDLASPGWQPALAGLTSATEE